MREYSLRLDKYGISRELYNELRWFCRQYPDKLAELSAVRGGFNDLRRDGMPKGGGISNPTERRAMRALAIRADIEAIEQAALAADAGLYREILSNVTRGVVYMNLDAPCGKNQFTAVRRKFFWHLACRLGKIGDCGAMLL